MPYYLSAASFKRQAKLVVKHWPFNTIKTTQARELLSQFYGYASHHQYQQLLIDAPQSLLPVTADIILSHYTLWVQKLANLGSMNQIQARQLLQHLWSSYLADERPLHTKLYQATLQFYGDCADFIHGDTMVTPFDYRFDDRPAIKDVIEAIGVPHPEVGGLRVNGGWVHFDYLLMHGDHVEVFPAPCNQATRPLPYKPNHQPTFLLDIHLGGLARYLRMAGFDCVYSSQHDYGDALLATFAATHDYILLTRDIGLLKRGKVNYGRWVRNVLPEKQFKEIVDHYQLIDDFQPFSRCIKCNGAITAVTKETIATIVPPRTLEKMHEFSQCQSCQQVYWKGSHYDKIRHMLGQAAAQEA